MLLLDEAQLIHDERGRHGEHPLSLLLAPIVALQRRELPLGLVLCGLPTLAGNLQKARSYSERLFRGEDVDSLAPAEATGGVHQAARTDLPQRLPHARQDRRRRSRGLPLLPAAVGSELWDAADLAGMERLTPKLLDATRPDIYNRLDHDFYEPRLTTLTPAEQDLLLASALAPTRRCAPPT